uniref:Uncharacterized protein n=1 Tax=Leersia perrieri TaxID=77586 RepID=A0A0D9VFU5_9ORYZ
MTSEDGEISALLCEPSVPEEQPEASEFDDVVPAILESIRSHEKAFEPSPEEAAWADSCFVQTSELSDSDWGKLKAALLNALEKEIPNDTSEAVHEQGAHAILEVKSLSLTPESVSQNDDVQMEQKVDSEDDTDTIEASEVANVIRGTNEHGKQMDGYTAEYEDGDVASSEGLEQTESRETIFKVWDLDVSLSDDEDELELIKDLKKLLKDNPQESEFQPPSGTAKTLSQINIDDLVADLSDLSLQQTNE